MYTSGTVKDEEKSAGYFFKLGVIPFLLVILIFFFTLFMFNQAIQLEGWEYYGKLSEWYMYSGFFGMIGLSMVMSREKDRKYQTVVFDDPYRSWKDFLSILMGVFFGLGTIALARAGLPFAQSVEVPEPALQLIVATVEETTFRLAFPALLYIAFHDSKINLSAWFSFFLAILISNIVFAFFHYASYQLTIENAKTIIEAGVIDGIPLSAEQIAHYTKIANTPFLQTLMSAFAFGMVQSIAFFAAVRLAGSGGEWAILGVIGGHYIWNLYQVSLQKVGTAELYNPWYYIGAYLLVIFLLMFSIGYFFKPRVSRVGSHYRKQRKKTLTQSFLSFIPFYSLTKKRR